MLNLVSERCNSLKASNIWNIYTGCGPKARWEVWKNRECDLSLQANPSLFRHQ
jgi:hypothetical protein